MRQLVFFCVQLFLLGLFVKCDNQSKCDESLTATEVSIDVSGIHIRHFLSDSIDQYFIQLELSDGTWESLGFENRPVLKAGTTTTLDFRLFGRYRAPENFRSVLFFGHIAKNRKFELRYSKTDSGDYALIHCYIGDEE